MFSKKKIQEKFQKNLKYFKLIAPLKETKKIFYFHAYD